MKIAIVGSINADITVNVKEFAKCNETVIGDRSYVLSQGGKGANQAAAAASAGASPRMIARVGDDDLGVRAIESLERAGVDCRHVRKTPGVATGLAAILVNQHGDNIISVASGANACLTVEDVLAAEDAIAESSALIVQLEVPLDTVTAAIRLARKHGATVILNPAPAPQAALPFLSDVDVLVPNENEALALAQLHGTPADAAESAGQALFAAGARNVVVTMGAKGCLLVTAEGAAQQPAYQVKAVDTTGAGDTFCGFLANALTRGAALAEAVDEASAAAALAVTRQQARDHLPTQAELEAFRAAQP